jgi:roadblock/LC7 domain-containing protein
MASLRELLELDGVVTAVEFSEDGKLVDHASKRNVPPELLEMTAEFWASITMLHNTLASAYTRLNRVELMPQHGWAYWGGDWSIVIGGDRGVIAETKLARLDQLVDVLLGRA